mgnify:CR=1 FL=1
MHVSLRVLAFLSPVLLAPAAAQQHIWSGPGWERPIEDGHLPEGLANGQTTYRAVSVDGENVEFSDGFTDLHTASYEAILAGKGYGLNDVRPSIEVVSALRGAAAEPGRGEQHPLTAKALR